MLKIGSHVSFSKDGFIGCINDTVSYGGNAFMFYTGAPQNTIRKSIDKENVKKGMELLLKNNIDIESVIVHAPYIVNLATDKIENREFGIEFIKKEISRCKELGIKYLVLHPGNAVGIEPKVGLDNLISSLNLINDEDVCIIIETMAGKGTEICRSIEELKYVFDNASNLNIGVTLDTCHLNDSGVDISKFEEYLDLFDELIGIEKIKCVHVNDSKNIMGAKKDRHENLGFGEIGFNSLLNVIYNERLKDIPKILETPFIKDGKKSYPPYKFEIEMIKNKNFNEHMIENILEYK